MYDLVYEFMKVSGVAEKLVEPEWQDDLGEKVTKDREVGE